MRHSFPKIVRILAILGLLAVPGSSLSFAQTGGQQQGTIPVGPPPQDSAGLSIIRLDEYCATLELIIVDSSDSH